MFQNAKMITLYFLWKTLVILLGLTAFKIQVLSMLAIKFRGDFRIFNLLRQYISKKTAEDSSINLCILRQQWFWHTSSFSQWLWFDFLTDETTCSIAYLEHIWKGETEGNIYLVDHLVLVFLCTLVIVKEHIIQR